MLDREQVLHVARLARLALSDDEVGRGFVLTCQSRPVSAAVTVDFDA